MAEKEYRKRFTYGWTRKSATKKVKIAPTSYNEEEAKYYGHIHTAELTISQMSGEFEVAIDIEAIVNTIIYRAAHNRSKICKMLRGDVTAKRISEQVLSQEVKEFPIPDTHREVK